MTPAEDASDSARAELTEADLTDFQGLADTLPTLPLGTFDTVGEDGVRVLRDVVYTATAGFRPVTLDLYLPAPNAFKESPHSSGWPVVVFIHGGGWLAGHRCVFPPPLAKLALFDHITAAGFACATVDYRLAEEAPFPAQLHDVKAAVRWLRTRASELGLDTSLMVAWGESAGAHLACLLGLTSGVAELDGPAADGTSTAVQGVIDWYGPTNLALLDQDAAGRGVLMHDDPQSPTSRMLGAALPTVPTTAAQASPETYVHPSAPPFLIAHGVEDKIVPVGQSKRFAAMLHKVGVDVDFDAVPDVGHLFLGDPNSSRHLTRALRFLTLLREA